MFATAVDKWREELINTGRQEGILHTAQEMLQAGADIDFVQCMQCGDGAKLY